MTTPFGDISVTAPVGLAIDRMRQLLFRPFDLRKWLVIGFCAWLATLGEGGFRSGFNSNSWNKSGGSGREQWERIKDYVMNNLSWILPLTVTLVILGLALWVVLLWLSSRGRFMFLHCLARDVAEVETPWRRYAREATSLFWFRLVLALATMMIMLPLGAIIGFAIVRMVRAEELSAAGVTIAILTGITAICVGIVLAVVAKLTTDFVVPVMYLRGGTCRQAWAELRALFPENLGHLLLYLLFQILMTMIIGAMVILVTLATCCIAGCLFSIPYLGTVLLLPVLTFSRCYSIYYLAQFGPKYDVMAPLVEPPPSASGQ